MLFVVFLKVNDRDRAKLDEMSGEAGKGESGGGDPDREDTSSVASVEVANVTVGSMIRMATVDK